VRVLPENFHTELAKPLQDGVVVQPFPYGVVRVSGSLAREVISDVRLFIRDLLVLVQLHAVAILLNPQADDVWKAEGRGHLVRDRV